MAKPRFTALEETTYRVYQLPVDLRERFIAAREAEHLKTQEFLGAAVAQRLDEIVDGLLALGIAASEYESRPSRFPMTYGLIQDLKAGSEKTGLPASQLLLACLALHSAEKPKRKTVKKSTRRNGAK